MAPRRLFFFLIASVFMHHVNVRCLSTALQVRLVSLEAARLAPSLLKVAAPPRAGAAAPGAGGGLQLEGQWHQEEDRGN